jgi:hypothetical protein
MDKTDPLTNSASAAPIGLTPRLSLIKRERRRTEWFRSPPRRFDSLPFAGSFSC